jgi:hypothetical protein
MDYKNGGILPSWMKKERFTAEKKACGFKGVRCGLCPN